MTQQAAQPPGSGGYWVDAWCVYVLFRCVRVCLFVFIRRSSRHAERPRTVLAGPFACECLASMEAAMTHDVCQVMADLTELKFTKLEREFDPIVDSLHHLQCDDMAYMRLG